MSNIFHPSFSIVVGIVCSIVFSVSAVSVELVPSSSVLVSVAIIYLKLLSALSLSKFTYSSFVVLSISVTWLFSDKLYIVVITSVCTYFVFTVIFSPYTLGSYSTLSVSVFSIVVFSVSTCVVVIVLVVSAVFSSSPWVAVLSISLFDVVLSVSDCVVAVVFVSSVGVFSAGVVSVFCFSTISNIETSYAFCIVCFSFGNFTLVSVAKSISVTSSCAFNGI